MKRAALFLDRDGVINVDYGYVYRKEDFDFIDGIFELVSEANKAGYLVVIVTNQAGIGRGYYTKEDFHSLMKWVSEQFAKHSCRIDGIYHCPCHPLHGIGKYRKDCGFRKPSAGMFLQAAIDLNIDLHRSIMVGDKESDMLASRNAGLKGFFFLGVNHKPAFGYPIKQLVELTHLISTGTI